MPANKEAPPANSYGPSRFHRDFHWNPRKGLPGGRKGTDEGKIEHCQHAPNGTLGCAPSIATETTYSSNLVSQLERDGGQGSQRTCPKEDEGRKQAPAVSASTPENQFPTEHPRTLELNMHYPLLLIGEDHVLTGVEHEAKLRLSVNVAREVWGAHQPRGETPGNHLRVWESCHEAGHI